ncbi:MAG: hypothetical protein ABJD97_08140, partial [Betaproteobacteria bacterium]
GAAGVAPWLFDVGHAASDEAAEAIALLLPWPADAPARPALADWLAAWQAAAAQPAARRADAIVAAIARLDDAISRRWAVRAACGLAKPMVTAWQWQRAWAQAFDIEPHAAAWWWQRERQMLRTDASAASLASAVPRPHAFAPLLPAAEEAHAQLLAGWHRGDLHAQPRWRGVRVQIVRRGADVAVGQRAGALLNAALPAAFLAPERWPDGGVIEAVLLAWRDGRGAPLDEALARERKAGAATLHLALVDWHRWPEHDAATLEPAQRRARLHARWPAPGFAQQFVALPEVFTSPWLPLPDPSSASGLAGALAALQAAGATGLVLRHRADAQAWVVRPALHRVRAALQYVPGDALAASAGAAAALGFLECGFAVWSRVPLSDEEQAAAMTAAMAGEFLPPPAHAPHLDGLRMLPLARLPIALPNDELQRLHAWLRANAGQRFGGVHAVAPALVFELGFESLRASRRHRSGVVLVGARVLRWLHDAAPGAAHRLADLPPRDGDGALPLE